jgi:hypothetical protein
MLPSEAELIDLDRQLRAHLGVTGAELAAACAQQASNAARIVIVIINVAVSLHACRQTSLQSVNGVAGARVVACLPHLRAGPCMSFQNQSCTSSFVMTGYSRPKAFAPGAVSHMQARMRAISYMCMSWCL